MVSGRSEDESMKPNWLGIPFMKWRTVCGTLLEHSGSQNGCEGQSNDPIVVAIPTRIKTKVPLRRGYRPLRVVSCSRSAARRRWAVLRKAAGTQAAEMVELQNLPAPDWIDLATWERPPSDEADPVSGLAWNEHVVQSPFRHPGSATSAT